MSTLTQHTGGGKDSCGVDSGTTGQSSFKKDAYVYMCVCMSVSGVKERFQEQVTLKLRLQRCRDQPGAEQGNECSRQGTALVKARKT